LSGSGELHLSILIETIRREGYEFQVGKPEVITKDHQRSSQMEPIEDLMIDIPDEFLGAVTAEVGSKKRTNDRYVCRRKRQH
jgi:GTP-binding protein